MYRRKKGLVIKNKKQKTKNKKQKTKEDSGITKVLSLFPQGENSLPVYDMFPVRTEVPIPELI